MNVDLRHALEHLENRGIRTACQGDHGDRWTADDPELREWAAHQCNGCPIFRECATAAEQGGEKWGVWAGIDRDPKSKKSQPSKVSQKMKHDNTPDATPPEATPIDWSAPPVSWNGDLTPEVERVIDMSKV